MRDYGYGLTIVYGPENPEYQLYFCDVIPSGICTNMKNIDILDYLHLYQQGTSVFLAMLGQ